MTPDQYRQALSSDSQAFAQETASQLSTDIDFIDDWTVRDLVAHLGAVYASVAANAGAGSTEATPAGDEATAPDGEAIVDWFAERRQALLDVFAATDPDASAWTFTGVKTASWWLRRMAHETAVHLWDARAAIGSPDQAPPIDSDLATDGIDEYIEVGLRRSSRRPVRVYPAETLHLHRTDGPGEWMFARGETENDVVVTNEHGKGDAAVRGSASNLLVWIWGRPTTDVEIFGDPDVATAWQAVAP